MSKPQDDFVSRFLNRPISRCVTSFLLKFPIHPNAWTISIFVLPLIACLFLVRGDYVSLVVGAAIFQAFSGSAAVKLGSEPSIDTPQLAAVVKPI